MKKKCLIIVAGGTGGHFYPALAIAEELRTRNKLIKTVLLVQPKKNIDLLFYQKYADDILYMPYVSIYSSSWRHRIVAIPGLIWNIIWNLFNLVKYKKYDCKLVSFGSYVAFSNIIASIILRIPVVIHEQNAKIGLVNKWFSKYAKMLLEGFPGTFNKFNAYFVGIPLKKEIINDARLYLKKSNSNENLNKNKDQYNILIIGGSSGSKIINKVIPKVFSSIKNKTFNIVHQIGIVNDEKEILNEYKNKNIKVEVLKYINNISTQLIKADLVISRAGASILYECALFKKPMVVIPLPTKDNHQLSNAEFFVKLGGIKLIKQNNLQDLSFEKDLLEYLNNLNYLNLVNSNKIKNLTINNSAKLFVDLLLKDDEIKD